jgi:poly(A) polymerase
VTSPFVLSRGAHPISRRGISPEAIKVLYRLHRQGFMAYLCGGCVRDLILGIKPRDFDVVTDAHPQQIRHLFRNSRIIGRRFRLVHILFTDEVIEVATFRRTPEAAPPELEEREARVWLNNAFGTPEEDAFRRDFTVNGLYYNIADFSVHDYVGGLEDLRARMIRMIGDPERRILEDPVRMLRALSLSARLKFRVQPELFLAILRHKGEIRATSPSRLLEEFLKIIRSGASAPSSPSSRRRGCCPSSSPFWSPWPRPRPMTGSSPPSGAWTRRSGRDAHWKSRCWWGSSTFRPSWPPPGTRAPRPSTRPPRRSSPSRRTPFFPAPGATRCSPC